MGLDSAFGESASTFFLFFFLLSRETDFTIQRQILLFIYCFVTVHHCSDTVHTLKNIKNRPYNIIYTFKNYFATVFSVFSFQFSISATISSIQMDPYTLPNRHSCKTFRQTWSEKIQHIILTYLPHFCRFGSLNSC